MRDVEENLQRLIDTEIARPNTHSIVLSVRSGDGTLDFSGAAGKAKHDAPFFVASVSKIFTAAAIMQLVDQGWLDLNERISKYLSHLPIEGIHIYKGTDYSDQLTIRQLLHQTSGLADYFADGLVEDFKQNKDHLYSVEDVLRIISKQKPVAAPDSGKSYYSDTNYQLLGAIIEAATDQPLAEALTDRIFAPQGMADTYLYDYTAPPAVAPLPFYFKDTKLSLPHAMTSERGTGAAVSTTADIHRFLRAFFGGQLFDKAHLSQMMNWNRMFFPMQYGYGIWRYQLPRWMTLFQNFPEFIGHAGVNGAMAFYNPDHDVYIAGTLNQLDDPSRQFKFMPKVINALK